MEWVRAYERKACVFRRRMNCHSSVPAACPTSEKRLWHAKVLTFFERFFCYRYQAHSKLSAVGEFGWCDTMSSLETFRNGTRTVMVVPLPGELSMNASP